MSSAHALRLCLLAMAVSVLCFALHLGITRLHLPLTLPTQAVTYMGVFGMTWPLWAYAAATYHRALSAGSK
jgi:hypothetical protein